jgi:geranylgeranyl diphosphate synthase type II
VADAMRYSVTAGGKRLRPILCLASAEAVGGDRSMAMPVACAIELIHTYSLVHDDLPAMDNDTMRRGRPTLHVVAGEGMAILAGDGLLTEAFAVMAATPAGADTTVHLRQLRVIGIVARAAGASGMVGGQALDLTGNGRGRDDEAAATSADQLALISSKKTGALIRASAVAGAIMGGASDHDVAVIDDAAAQFGLAFQIIDDILDVEGVASTLGKTIGKDAAAGKPTYPAIYGLDVARRMAGACLEKAERSLRSACLTDSRLMDIGRWIVDRSN